MLSVDSWISLVDRIMWFILILSAFTLGGIIVVRLTYIVVDLLKPVLLY